MNAGTLLTKPIHVAVLAVVLALFELWARRQLARNGVKW